jgi:hypothetical protein
MASRSDGAWRTDDCRGAAAPLNLGPLRLDAGQNSFSSVIAPLLAVEASLANLASTPFV